VKANREEQTLVTHLNLAGWIFLLSVGLVCVAACPLEITASAMIGGMLVMVNLHFLKRVVTRASAQGSRVRPQSVLPKYYLMFALTVAVIFILISQHMVNPLGFLLGLAVFVMAVFTVVGYWACRIIYKTITKEAV
jgi:hypothetical protein